MGHIDLDRSLDAVARLLMARVTSAMGGRMLVATRSFLADYDGRQVRVVAGKTRIAVDHELAGRFADRFEPAAMLLELGRGARRGPRPSRPSTARLATVAPAVPRRPGHPTPAGRQRRPWEIPSVPQPPVCREIRLRNEPGEVEVRISESVRSDLREVLRQTTAVDGLEAGGVLLGPRRVSDKKPVEVVMAGGPGEDARREANSFGRDHIHDLSVVANAGRSSDGQLVELGVWHSHPTGDDVPSGADLEHFGSMRNLLGGSLFVAVIATPHRDYGWGVPAFAVWVIRSGFADLADICERARV
jgi:integrative and conjugative element protein (TIGR02256 family)